MRSKVLITYERSRENGIPCIKIVVPIQQDASEESDDPKDLLVEDFLHTPLYVSPNILFERGSYFPDGRGNQITTIKPLRYDEMLSRFETVIVNRFSTEYELKYEAMIGGLPRDATNQTLWKIRDFFKYLHELEDVNHESFDQGTEYRPSTNDYITYNFNDIDEKFYLDRIAMQQKSKQDAKYDA